jgi:hypothetical protein
MAPESQEPIAEEKKTGSVKKLVSPKTRPGFSGVLSAVVFLLIEMILPAVVAGGVLLWLFGGYNLWQIGRPTSLVIFAVVLVVVALLFAVALDSVTTLVRNSRGLRSVAFARDPRVRLVKLALGGLLLPLILFGAANLLPYSTHGTAMNYLIALAVPPVKLTPPDEVGAIAMRAQNPATKQLSIQVLQGFQSPEALNQLVKLLNEDSSALSDPAVAGALCKAFAAYGVTARDPLLDIFRGIDPQQAGSVSTRSGDLYDRYFGQSFETLKAEVTSDTVDPAARETQLAQVQAAQANLKSALADVRYTPAKTGGGDPRLDFILQVFLATDLKQDADLLAFARTIAVDTRYSSQVRGDALLLIAKLGEQKDLDLLYTQLKSSDDLLLARVLQAISVLQTRLAAGGAE